MKINNPLLPTLLSLLLTGCWLGDHFPPYEVGQVSRTDAGFCFQINNAGDYYVHYLSIRDRHAPERSGFNRKLPALKVANNQLCIPDTYYQFPDYGEINVDISLRSPTERRMIRRIIISEFRTIKGVPHPFAPRDYSVLTVDYIREREKNSD
ncbi:MULTISPECIES: putative T6SS immunity periplasmic lipoprotein [Erwinia]|uniref:DUF7480 domain-containing protein n=1 Tax=Erwinia rhapontici TaxID=55212 RepID=A0ABM7N2B6_ERWRD|nr:putative T6SS immunity periplasmic lipoprotein [Erwinia rhapontici]BCQ35599.1 hypothetical protein ERHA53_29420 [Erwinia rhapontici]BCQ40501.1 hypothetical protein ERHA54_31040 [Erwinia rhapontici]BCQ45781.1 hypothetical protein ERHA55_33080 [Erwinia rhapontici]